MIKKLPGNPWNIIIFLITKGNKKIKTKLFRGPSGQIWGKEIFLVKIWQLVLPQSHDCDML